VEKLIASAASHATANYGLTAEGREQVRRAAAAALADGVLAPGCRVVSSPLLRARESAAILGQLLETDVRVDERLTERGFGELELGPDSRYRDVWAADREDPSHQRWGVESAGEVLARAVAVIADLERADPAGRFVLCTHGDVASVLLCAGLGLPLNQHRDVGATDNGQIRPLPWHGLAPRLGTGRVSR
jgi:probable phosphoglycerate mutase